MKWSQLIQSIIDLNDGETIENDTTVVSAANLALSHLARYIEPHGCIEIQQDENTADAPGKIDTNYSDYCIKYALDVIAPDMIDYSAHPHLPLGDEIPDSYLIGNSLIVPKTFRGKIIVDYRRRHENVTIDTVAYDGEIDVQRGCEDMLTLLMAYYIWLEDEPQKADKFLQMFSMQVSAELSARSRAYRKERVKNSNGWR